MEKIGLWCNLQTMRYLLLIIVCSFTALAAPDVIPMVAAGAEAFAKNKDAESRAIFEAVLAAEPANKAAKNYLALLNKRKSAGATSVEAALQQVVLPMVNLREASPREAVAYIGQQVVKLTEGRQTMNVVWLVPDTMQVSPVTLQLQGVPATEALRYITASAGLVLTYDAHAVKVAAP